MSFGKQQGRGREGGRRGWRRDGGKEKEEQYKNFVYILLKEI